MDAREVRRRDDATRRTEVRNNPTVIPYPPPSLPASLLSTPVRTEVLHRVLPQRGRKPRGEPKRGTQSLRRRRRRRARRSRVNLPRRETAHRLQAELIRDQRAVRAVPERDGDERREQHRDLPRIAVILERQIRQPLHQRRRPAPTQHVLVGRREEGERADEEYGLVEKLRELFHGRARVVAAAVARATAVFRDAIFRGVVVFIPGAAARVVFPLAIRARLRRHRAVPLARAQG
eukprot:14893-Pelagococcus_subviridis.AAC.2